MDEFPRLRHVEPMIFEQDGEPLAIIRDPEELSGETMGVAIPTLMIMTMLDGRTSLRDIQAAVSARFRQIITMDDLATVLRELDASYLLDNERSRARLAEFEAEYMALPARPAFHAGTAYPDDPAELMAVLAAYFASPEGALGRPTPAAPPRALVTPHIDPRSGGPCMARGFHELSAPEAPTLYIILGVAHQPTPNLYTLATKDFETPLGPAKVNQAAAARLRELCGADSLAGEYAHMREHSIEFQTIFLNYIHRNGPEFSILPILCGSMHEELASGSGLILSPGTSALAKPINRPEVATFCRAIATLVEEFGPRVCVIAGVDLSHVGRKFGAEEGVDDLRAGLIRAADMRMLEAVAACDPEAFFDHFRPDRNARNVDAVSAVYTLLHAVKPARGELLGYDQHREYETESLVSFASLALR